jgi:hypothetical protein
MVMLKPVQKNHLMPLSGSQENTKKRSGPSAQVRETGQPYPNRNRDGKEQENP